MKKKIKILFIYGLLVPYIRRDYEILDRYFDLEKVKYGLKFQKFNPLNIIRTVNGMLRADIAFCWFIGYPAVITVTLAKLFRKTSVVVIGGGELVSVPEINYGFLQSNFLKSITKYVLCLADIVLPVSRYLEKKTKQNISNNKLKKVIRINNGVDFKNFNPSGNKKNIVLTTAFISKKNIIRKGLNTFLECARNMTDVNFVLVGEDRDGSLKKLIKNAPDNFLIIQNPSTEELKKWYDRAKVYCQLSLMETFGISLAEAMLFECVPITTNKGALPDVAGDSGYIVPYGNVDKTVEAIKKSLKIKNGKEARKQIQTHFSLYKREQELLKLFTGLTE